MIAVKGNFYIEKGKSCFSIHLCRGDLPVLIEIKTQLNIGTVNIHKKVGGVEFKVNSQKEIWLLIEIFKGKIFLHKRQTQFEAWCKNYIRKTHINIELKPYAFKPSLNDS